MAPTSAPIAEVISIGDEMTSGARLDTNSQWLSQQLGFLGVRVLYHSTVGDTLEACTEVLRIAVGRADVVITTGGLGPTADDLTREAVAAAAGTRLEFCPNALAHIERLFNLRNRAMPEANRIQAMFPVGSQIIDNPQGTAPGIDIAIDQPPAHTRLFALPGVPAEMTCMFEQSVAPAIRSQFGQQQVIRRRVIKCFGLGESDMEARLGGMIARTHSPLVGITVSKATISLRIEAIADSPAAADAQLSGVCQEIESRVSEFIFGEGDTYELQHAVTDALVRRGQRVCVLETGHAALVAGWLASIESAAQYAGGLSFADWRHACQALQPAPPHANSQPASAATATEATGDTAAAQEPTTAELLAIGALANHLCRLLDADWCLLVDHYPPLVPPEGHLIPRGEVRICVLGPAARTTAAVELTAAPRHGRGERGELITSVPTSAGPLRISTQLLGGHPEILQDRIAKAALFELFGALRGAPGDGDRGGLTGQRHFGSAERR